jgi:hypothetical protein
VFSFLFWQDCEKNKTMFDFFKKKSADSSVVVEKTQEEEIAKKSLAESDIKFNLEFESMFPVWNNINLSKEKLHTICKYFWFVGRGNGVETVHEIYKKIYE